MKVYYLIHIYVIVSKIVAGNGAYTGRTRFYDGKFELYQRTYGLTLKDGFEKNNIYGLYIFMKTIFEPDKMGGTHGSAITIYCVIRFDRL